MGTRLFSAVPNGSDDEAKTKHLHRFLELPESLDPIPVLEGEVVIAGAMYAARVFVDAGFAVGGHFPLRIIRLRGQSVSDVSMRLARGYYMCSRVWTSWDKFSPTA
jgi:hypothetical protein